MLTKIQFTPLHNKISFGTNMRETSVKLHPEGQAVRNCSFFVRGNSDQPVEVADYLVARAPQFKDIEWKIWGCADMSEFLARRIAMQKIMGKDNFRLKFKNIELIDIDPDIVDRNKKGWIGITKSDELDFSHSLDINYKEYFKKLKSNNNFFLDGEPQIVEGCKVKPHTIIPELLDNVKIRTGDIRTELKDIPSPKPNVLRIFDFANSWYFLSKDEQVDLALNFEQKLKLGDVLMIGRVEREKNVDKVLKQLGFQRVRTPWGIMETTLAKMKQLAPQQLKRVQQRLLKEGRHIIE